MIDFELVAGGGGHGAEVAGVGADDEVASAKGAFDDAGIDDVGGLGAAGEGSGGPGLEVIERLNVASGEDAGEEGLAGCAAPALGHDRRGDDGDLAAQEEDLGPGRGGGAGTAPGRRGAGVLARRAPLVGPGGSGGPAGATNRVFGAGSEPVRGVPEAPVLDGTIRRAHEQGQP
ncbi:MAG TPA: hypothetical protein VNF47_17465 [Streptosporangiaceae bacterium]|nr:hypothetical protein [Streptosporangiaceae bacterium]